MHAADEVTAEVTKGWYVYGIVPADTEVVDATAGLGGSAAPLEMIAVGDIAAIVSEVDIEGLGTTEDLLAHQRLMDDIAINDIPVLPFRFGAVVADRTAITEELLGPYRVDFEAALGEVTGRVEYVISARYVQSAILRQVLDEIPEAAALQEQVREMPVDASRDMRIQLGQLIGEAIEAKRREDTERVIALLDPHCVGVAEKEPTHELDAANVALLVDVSKQDALAAAVEQLASDWEARADVRLLGPVAAYDFVPQGIAEGEV